MLGNRVIIEQIGNRFVINKDSLQSKEDSERYDIYIPLETKKGEIQYNETTIPKSLCNRVRTKKTSTLLLVVLPSELALFQKQLFVGILHWH